MQWLDGSDADWTLEWLGLEEDGNVFPGYGDGGVDTLVLELQQGFTISFGWITDIIKTRSGREQRISRNDAPKQSYSGDALLAGNNVRAVRARMARHAVKGSAFLLGLPHEELTFVASGTGTSVFVSPTSLAQVDWAKPTQRVVVARAGSFVNAVVQSASNGTIVLDVSPGTLANIGGSIMPAMLVYLEPQQSFARYPLKVERWNLQARAALFGYAPTLAELALGPITSSPGLDNAKVTARHAGYVGNTYWFGLFADSSAPNAGYLSEIDGEVVFTYKGGTTTVGDLATALVGCSYAKLTGTWTASSTIPTVDQFAPIPLSGGGEVGDVGTGASLTTYAGDGTSRPVWDRYLDNESTNTDGVHAMTQILDHGGIPYALGTADEADWFRAVTLRAGLDGIDWQWFKKLIASVKGRQKAFWLPTWRDDLTFVSKGAGTITVSTADGSDFDAWWPHQREHIQILESNGSVTYAKITGAVDNGNGTRTLTIGMTLATSAVAMVSWLELCRFESDQYEIPFSDSGFEFSAVARVVQS
jgi:hypothetical protein